MAKNPESCRKLLKFMEIVTIIIMIVIFFVGMTSNLSINKTLDVYLHKNIFTAKLKFSNRIKINEENEDFPLPSNINDTKINPLHKAASQIFDSTHLNEHLKKLNNEGIKDPGIKEVGIKDTGIKDSTNQTVAGKLEISGNITKNDENDYNLTDIQFLEQMQVDLYAIKGRHKSLQEYLIYYPLITLIVATSWGALLISFRSGGYFNDEWLSIGPWRIVIPSIVCFLVMVISSSIYVFLSNKYSKRLCENLASNLTYPERYPCSYLIEKLAPIEPFHVFPTRIQFEIYQVSVKIDLILWLIALCMMTIRWAIAIDFELVKIILLPYCQDKSKTDSDYDEPMTTTIITDTKTTQLDTITEPPESALINDDDDDDDDDDKDFQSKKSLTESKDDLDCFESAHSLLSSNDDGMGQEFVSMESFLNRQSTDLNKNDGNGVVTKTESV